MQYLVTARDYPDALKNRLALRAAHIELGDQLYKDRKLLFGGAILDEKGAMTGSLLICDFPDRNALDAWLAIEPYVTGKVWQTVSVEPFAAGPSFRNALAVMATHDSDGQNDKPRDSYREEYDEADIKALTSSPRFLVALDAFGMECCTMSQAVRLALEGPRTCPEV